MGNAGGRGINLAERSNPKLERNNMKKYLLALYFFPAIFICQETFDFSGNLNYYSISRLSDGSLINQPFRIANFNIQKEHNNFSIYSHLAMEYRIPSDNHYLDDSNSQDFIWDLRELYMSWQLKHGEIRIGKQIHSWGSTDGNSPIDNLNANDYYYLFESGADQKLGSFSTAADFYLGSWKLGFTFSPIHQTSRLPLNDPEFPVGLPVNPKSSQVIEVENPLEAGGYIRKSFDRGEITLSYFNGYDRIFSPSGFNVWDNETFNMPEVVIDTIFSYRKTQSVGMGIVLFLGELNLRGDFAYFTTKDPSINFIELDYLGTALSDIDRMFYTNLRENDSKEFNVNAEYYQTNFQFEYEAPWNLKITGQYIKYDILKYFDNLGIVNINLPGLEVNFDPADYFSPGMGVPTASLTKNVLLLDLTKTFYDNQIELNMRTMMDQVHSGKLIEMGLGYDINESLKSYLAINSIIGDDSQGEMYTFNHMEDFSHIRMELKYFY
jgi:hypothetical protein